MSHPPFRLLSFLSASLATLTAGNLSSMAAEFRSDEVLVIKADEVIDGDLYAFGRQVTVEGTIKGDLLIFGAEVVIKGTVEGDLVVAGQTVLIEGTVGDDVRIAGQIVKFAEGSEVADDSIVAGMSLELTPGSTIGGDQVSAGYQGDFGGEVDGDVLGAFANCRLAGAVGGDVRLEIGGDGQELPPQAFGPPLPLAMPSVPPGLTIEKTAKLDGVLSYTALKEANIDEGATIAEEPKFTQQQLHAAAPPTTQEIVLSHARHFIVVALLGLIAIALLPRWNIALAANIRARPLLSLAGGLGAMVLFFVLLVAIFVGVIVLAILFGAVTLSELAGVVVVLGLLSGLGLIGGFWLFTVYLAPVVTGLALGQIAIRAPNRGPALAAFFLGFSVFFALCLIPYAGTFIAWIGMLLALGGLMLWIFSGVRTLPAEKSVEKPVLAT